MPEVRATGEFGLRPDDCLEIDALQCLRLVPNANLVEAKSPARPVGDGRGPRDRQWLVAPLAVEDGARRIAQLWVVGQDLDPNVTTEPVNAAHECDDEPLAFQNRHPPQ